MPVTVLSLVVTALLIVHTHTHTQPFYGPFSRTTQVSWYQKGKTGLDFTETVSGSGQQRQSTAGKRC